MESEPWKINSDLTKERIVIIANLIANVRGEVIDLHDAALGDTPLSLGTRAYECLPIPAKTASRTDVKAATVPLRKRPVLRREKGQS